MRLDDRDVRLLRALQENARLSRAALAERIALSPTACGERLRRLEASGIIKGYGVRLAPEAFDARQQVFMEVELANHRAEDFTRFERAIEARAEIVACWALGGVVDYLLQFAVADIDAYQRAVDALLAAEIGIARYVTRVVTKPIKVPLSPPLPAPARPDDPAPLSASNL